MGREVTVLQALVLGFKTKGLRFYGRSSRSEFWKFFLLSWVMIAASVLLTRIPVVGSLIQALLIIAILCCQYSAIIRRLHDLDRSGKIIALPYLIAIAYFVALMPVHALYPEHATTITSTIAGCAMILYLYILYLCGNEGTQGPNRYGTDPCDESQVQQDYVNPEHFADPEYLGDPWRKFKHKVAKEKAQKQAKEQTATTAQAANAAAHADTSADAQADAAARISVPTPGSAVPNRPARRQRHHEQK